MNDTNSNQQPSRAEVDSWQGATMMEFGTSWCGYCRAAQPLIAAALSGYPRVRHIRISDGPGLPLGRSFHVKLWPTLIFLADGKMVVRLVRPADSAAIRAALAQINA